MSVITSSTSTDLEAWYARELRRFERDASDNGKFWARLGGRPDFTGLSVLEVGCGRGGLSMEIAAAGAARVLGIDINRGRIDFAAEHVRRARPELQGKAEFRAVSIERLDQGPFDAVVTKDTFEHVMDLDGMLREIERLLKPHGRLYAGWGPLYPSPYGDHDRRRTLFAPYGLLGRAVAGIPWAHLALERVLVRLHNRAHQASAQSLRDLGLNKLAFSDYRAAFARSSLSVERLETNRTTRKSSRVLAALGKLPFLADYCTHNVYCVLEKQ